MTDGACTTLTSTVSVPGTTWLRVQESRTIPTVKRARAITIALLILIAVGCGRPGGNGFSSNTTNETGPRLTPESTAPTNIGAATNSDNEEHPPPNDVALGECIPSGTFGPSATGTLTNTTSELSNYMISVNFTDEAGIIVASALGIANNIPSGASATWEAESFDTNVTAAGCAVVKVDRYSAE